MNNLMDNLGIEWMFGIPDLCQNESFLAFFLTEIYNQILK